MLDSEKDKTKILKYVLLHYGELSRNSFKRIVCDELKLMSHQTFQKYLNEAVDKGLIFKSESYEGKVRKVWYYATKDLTDFEKDRLEYFKTGIMALDKMFDMFLKKFDKQSMGVQAEVLALYYKAVDSMLFNARIFSKVYFKHSKDFKEIISRLEHFRHHHLDGLFYNPHTKDVNQRIRFHQLVMIEFFSDSEKSIEEVAKLLTGKRYDKYDANMLNKLEKMMRKPK